MMCPGRVGLHVFLWTDALKTSTLKSAYRAGIRQDFYSKNILSYERIFIVITTGFSYACSFDGFPGEIDLVYFF